MIINKITYEQLLKIITPKINFVVLKFEISHTQRVNASLVSLESLDEYHSHIQNNLCIVIYDREKIKDFKKNYFFKLKDILKNVNNLNRFELKNIIVMLSTHFPSYKSFIENQEQIIEYITLIRQTSKQSQKIISNLQKKLSKLIDFALISKDTQRLSDFTENQITQFLKKKKPKDIDEKFKLRSEFLQSREYKDAYSGEYDRLARNNYKHYIEQENRGLLSLLDIFFVDNELVITNNKMFEDKKQELIELTYKQLYEMNYAQLLEQGSPSKAKLTDAIKIYSRIHREFNTINLYSLDFTYDMNDNIKSIFIKLYSEIGKHTLNTLEINDETALLNEIYQENLYQEDLLSLFIQHNQEEDKKLQSTLKKLIELDITDSDWRERAEEIGIEIPDDYIDESEIYQYQEEQRETFYEFIQDKTLKDVNTKYKTLKTKKSQTKKPSKNTENIALDIDLANLSEEEIETVASDNFFNYFSTSTKDIVQCTCSTSLMGEDDIITCTEYLKNKFSFNEEDLIELSKEVECQLIIYDLLKNDNVSINKNLLLNPYIEDVNIIDIVKADYEQYFDFIIDNIELFNENIFELIFENVYTLDYNQIDTIFDLDRDTLKLQLLQSPLLNEYILEKLYEEDNDFITIELIKNEDAQSFIETKYKELSLSKNIEILKLIASKEISISEEIFVNLFNSQNEEVLELLEQHDKYCQKYCPEKY